jgi:hypothetical protein
MRFFGCVVVIFIVAVLLVHNLPSPFPSPLSTLDKTYGSLVAEFGPPSDLDPNAQLPSTKSGEISRVDEATIDCNMETAIRLSGNSI